MIINLNDEVIRAHQHDAPIDVVALARALGVAVWEYALPVGTSGKLFADQNNGGTAGYSIVVNGLEPLVRKRFTVAHELGHFMLHRDQIGPSGLTDDVWYRSGLSTTKEAEANRVAADILMPRHLIESYRHVLSPESMAKKFQVSLQAMKIRLGLVG